MHFGLTFDGKCHQGGEAWFPVLELAERWHSLDVADFLSTTFAAASLELLDAAKIGDTKRANLARRADADLEGVDWEYGYTPLLWAARKGSANMIKFLLGEGAEVNASCMRGGNKGTTALMEATTWSQSSHPHLAAMHALLTQTDEDDSPRVEVDAQRGDGATALCLAAWVGNEPATRMLLEHGADPSHKYMGKTALHFAKKYKHAALIATLQDAGQAWRMRALGKGVAPMC